MRQPVKPLKYRAAGNALLMIALASFPARAAVVLKLDLPELVLRAEHIVLAVARQKSARFTPRGRIVTDVTLTVNETLKGDFRPGQDLVVTRLGGEVGERAMLVEGAPRFQIGRSALVFLRRAPATGELQVVGMSQGLFRIEQSEGRFFLIPGGGDLSLVDRNDDSRLFENPGATVFEPAPLDDLLRKIRRLVAESDDR